MTEHAGRGSWQRACGVLFMMPPLVALLWVGPVLAQDMPAETDCWLTQPGTQDRLPSFPAGFFGTKGGTPSDPIASQIIAVDGVPLAGAELASCGCPAPAVEMVWLDPHGDPVAPDSIHAVGKADVPGMADPVDTCVRRNSDVTFSGTGVTETVPIELIQLSLKSTSPITVTFGAQPPSLFDVFITEDGVQALGAMDFTPSVLLGGTTPQFAGQMNIQDLPVNFRLDFVDQTPLGLPPQQITGLSLNFQGVPGTFSNLAGVVPVMSNRGLMVLIAGILVGSLIFAAFQRRRSSRAA